MQLQMLVAVAEEGSLQKASARVFRTAPAVSIAISKLEDEIGTPLLDRTHRHALRLTAAGGVLADYARKLVSLRDEALAAMEGIRNVERGHLRIGANQSMGEYLLPQLTQAFQRLNPGVKLKVVIGYSDAVLSALKHWQLDIALVAGQPQDQNLRGHLLMRDRLVAIMTPRHHLADHEVIRVHDLAGQPLILLTATSELRERVAETFQRYHLPLNVQVETGTLESIKKMALRDMGVGIVPRMCVQEEAASGDLVVKTVQEFRQERMLWMVCRRTVLSPACRALMKVIRSEMKALAKGGPKRILPRESSRRRDRPQG